ncbi:hypothetical protein CYL21_0888 [Plasmodium falciparum NF54]|uniref:Uncharacterized protein n=2 Tax=Plasmodium falciparum TaxID=5833 RepID=Q8I2Q7_PLAF7|nr:conserved Plasmodium protein, unknown function [Plasmodium falciparum 3D7]KAF4330515.1 hypothetical protein CYL21_0888 [Plasmodium falciparum NF54]PKC45268.1 hypothetical protein CK202_4262 [Plasmodium falciparum NF54]CAD51932.1 conserved Plasmodium protein, unknown function [Plasmodium falciparum 3D7]|eukprot:XP_001352121.1 conserved Plasmodium protein, unknown function [Plasmodium falciparum 3D7]
MEERKWSYIMVSVIFYLCYFFYFLTYSYEIIFLFQTKIDYIVFCLLFITSLFSIYFCSKGLKYICTFLITIISLIEIYEYTNNIPKDLYDEEFLKLFLLVRLFSAVNLVVFLYLHIKNLKNIKDEKLNNDKDSTIQSVAEPTNTTTENNHNQNNNHNNNNIHNNNHNNNHNNHNNIHNNHNDPCNNHNDPCNNYYKNQDNFLKSNTVTYSHNNLFKENIPHVHQHTGIITSKTLPQENIYVLKHVSIPIFEKEIINKDTNISHMYEMQTNDSFNHYQVNNLSSSNNINDNKITEPITTHNLNKNNNAYTNHIIQNNHVPNYTYEHPKGLQYYPGNFHTHNMGNNIQ